MAEARITPEEMIARLSIEQLCQTAEDYYASLTDYTFHMAKPFGGAAEAPDLLYNLALLLSGLRLGPTMTVLDFGGGTGWLSRFLNQMKCATITVDPSRTALQIGEELFERLPVLGGSVARPRFIPFEGRRIDLPDQSVDRVVCFDAFHHVPNPDDILGEFYRVLKPGGVAGFSEPGRFHSQGPQSQYEMRNYAVLENDIRLDKIKQVAEELGFGELRIKPIQPHSVELSYRDYERMTKWRYLPLRVWHAITSATRRSTIFFLTKGQFHYDSRLAAGLGHQMAVVAYDEAGRPGEPLQIAVRVTNSGTSTWLHENLGGTGVVRIGAHLYDGGGKLIELGFARHGFGVDVLPGETVERQLTISLPESGSYQLALDLVSEGVCWFENLGSQPQFLKVTIAG